VLARLAVHAKQSVLAVLDELLEPMEKTLALKLKLDAVKQEVDRNEDMLRSCLRAIDALSRMEDVETCQRFQTFMKTKVLGVSASTRQRPRFLHLRVVRTLMMISISPVGPVCCGRPLRGASHIHVNRTRPS
jgi:hypothetical protein